MAQYPPKGGNDRCLIDSGYKPGIIQNVRQKIGGVIMASKGLGIKVYVEKERCPVGKW
jgi:hypothetical protein